VLYGVTKAFVDVISKIDKTKKSIVFQRVAADVLLYPDAAKIHNRVTTDPNKSALIKITMAELESSSPSQPPSELRSSPAARAFFAALDRSKNEDEAKDKIQKKQSSFIKKRIQTLGWRNRFSQDDYYPVSVHVPKNNNGSDGEQQQQSLFDLCEFSVLQVQRGELEGTYGTGATVWPASMVLLKYLEKHASTLLRNKIVVDLGSGTGVTSIGAAVLGASHVTCTDGESKVVQLAMDNVERVAKQLWSSDFGSETPQALPEQSPSRASSFLLPNRSIVDVELYWWGSGAVPGGESACDVVLVSDCVLPKLYPIAPLVEALNQLLHKAQSLAIISYEHRYYPDFDPRDKFRELATIKGLTVHVVSLEEHDAVYSTDDIEIWHVRRDVSA
jgi:predicted nicotinamide N-methyase